MPLSDSLRRLLTAPGPSGYEQPAAAVFREAAGAFAEITYDTVGSTVARVKGTGDGPLPGPIHHCHPALPRVPSFWAVGAVVSCQSKRSRKALSQLNVPLRHQPAS